MAELKRVCPHCGANLATNWDQCDNCGLSGSAEPQQATESVPRPVECSYVEPIWQLLVFSVCTFGLYALYWFYRNWRDLKADRNLEISPGWRTFGLLIIILNFWLVYDQFRMIRHVANQAGVRKLFRPDVALIAFIVLTLPYRIPDVPSIPIWIATLGLLSVLPIAVVQRTLNQYWGVRQPAGLPRRRLNALGIAALVLGAIFTFLVFYGMFMPDVA